MTPNLQLILARAKGFNDGRAQGFTEGMTHILNEVNRLAAQAATQQAPARNAAAAQQAAPKAAPTPAEYVADYTAANPPPPALAQSPAPPAKRSRHKLSTPQVKLLSALREEPQGLTAHTARARGLSGSSLYDLARKGHATKKGSRFYA